MQFKSADERTRTRPRSGAETTRRRLVNRTGRRVEVGKGSALRAGTCDTQDINRWIAGDRENGNDIFPELYLQLSDIARRQLGKGWRFEPLETDELVSELYLRLVRERLPEIQNRAHFFAICAMLAFRILIERVRKFKTDKCGGKIIHVSLHESIELKEVGVENMRRINEAIERLRRLDQWLFQVASLRLYLGMSYGEIAAALEVNESKIKRDWKFASTWLARELG